MPAPAPAVCAAPAPPPAPDRFDHVVDLLNPGGDPAVLRRAAGAWREMAARLRALAGELGSAVRQVGTTWQGPAMQSFAGHWARLEASVDEGARTFDDIAANLDQVADQIAETNEQVHELYATIGVTVALGAALSVVTVGFGSAAAAAAASAQAAQAATVVARLGTFLTISARAMSGFRATFVAFSQRWAIAAAGNGLATAAEKAVVSPNHNPFDGWSVSDVTKIALGATSAAGVAGIAAGSARLAPLAARHPLAASFATGFAGGSGASVVGTRGWTGGRCRGRRPATPWSTGRAAAPAPRPPRPCSSPGRTG